MGANGKIKATYWKTSHSALQFDSRGCYFPILSWATKLYTSFRIDETIWNLLVLALTFLVVNLEIYYYFYGYYPFKLSVPYWMNLAILFSIKMLISNRFFRIKGYITVFHIFSGFCLFYVFSTKLLLIYLAIVLLNLIYDFHSFYYFLLIWFTFLLAS